MMTVIRFILRIVLLPVQAVLTLLMFALEFVGGLAGFAFKIIGTLLVIGGICAFIGNSGSTALGWQGIIIGILVVAIPQALTLWGEEGLLGLKELLGRI